MDELTSLVPSDFSLDSALTGLSRVVDISNAFNSQRYAVQASNNALASARARSDAETSIAKIQAQANVDQARASAAASNVDFTNLGQKLVSTAKDNSTTILIALAAALGLGLVYMGARK